MNDKVTYYGGPDVLRKWLIANIIIWLFIDWLIHWLADLPAVLLFNKFAERLVNCFGDCSGGTFNYKNVGEG